MNDFFLPIIVGLSPLVILCIVFFIIGLKIKRRTRNWTHSTGVIVQKEKHIIINLRTLLSGEGFESKVPDSRPTVQYEIDGTQYEYTSKIGQTPGFMPDTIVDIMYNPENPEEVVIDSFVQRGAVFLLIGWILFGISLLILGGILLVWILSS